MARRRRGAFILLSIGLAAMPLAWWRSSGLRVAVYELAYPLVSRASQEALFERLEDEERPGIAWDLFLSTGGQETRSEAWSALFERVVEGRGLLPPGLEDRVIDKALSGDEEALGIAVASRLREPRLAPLVISTLESGDSTWLGAGLGFLGGDPEAARRALDRALGRLDLARKRFQGQQRSSLAGVGELEELELQGAAYLLEGYAGLGEKARRSVEKIRRWRGCGLASVDDAAALALWRCAGDVEALAHLKRRFDQAPIVHRPDLARNLALAGEGEAACRSLTRWAMDQLEAGALAHFLEFLAARGIVCRPILKGLADQESLPGESARLILRCQELRQGP